MLQDPFTGLDDSAYAGCLLPGAQPALLKGQKREKIYL